MHATVPTLAEVIPSAVDGAYAQELSAALVALAALAAVLVVAWLVLSVTFTIVRVVTVAARLPLTAAFLITGGLGATVVVIGLLNR
ncbi:hypothetical protein [Actinoplanes palleronii]|nr:hypothetical protein [Actinoplanes palleronii]